MILDQIKSAIRANSNPEKASILMKFFKTRKGEYGEGDTFLGVTVPLQRKIANHYYKELTLDEIDELLADDVHEFRLTALLILVNQYEKTKDKDVQKNIVNFYLAHTSRINNWDLVDTSCYKILGHYCYHENEELILFRLANSENLWEKRIAIVSTMYFIKKNALSIVPEIVIKNINHPHDLMHKANGWMLREMGKKDEELLTLFLDVNTPRLPRTTLRYAIERLNPELKNYYMKLK